MPANDTAMTDATAVADDGINNEVISNRAPAAPSASNDDTATNNPSSNSNVNDDTTALDTTTNNNNNNNNSVLSSSSSLSNKKKRRNYNRRKKKYSVQLFEFNPYPSIINGTNNNSNINEEDEMMTGSSRPKRKLKAIRRYEPHTSSFASSSHHNHQHVKTGYGFACPRCTANCSYAARICEECSLECYYEAGVGVVVLKERRNVLQSGSIVQLMQQVTRGDGADDNTSGGNANSIMVGQGLNENANDASSTHGNELLGDNNMNAGNENDEDEIAEGGIANDFWGGADNDDAFNNNDHSNDDSNGTHDSDATIPIDKTSTDHNELNENENENENSATVLVEMQDQANEELTNQVDTLQGIHDDVANALRSKEFVLKELESRFATVSAERDELGEKVKTSSIELTMAQEEVSKYSAAIKKLEAGIEESRMERDADKEQVDSFVSNSKGAESVLKAEKDRLSSQLSKVNAELKSADAEKTEALTKTSSAIATKDKAVKDMAQMESEHTATFATLHTQIESLKQQLSNATAQISTMASEKTALVTRIASALEDDVAKMLREKDVSLEEARSAIASLKADGGEAASTLMMMATSNVTATNSSGARKVSLEEADQPHFASMNEMEASSASPATATPLSPRKIDGSAFNRPHKSAMTKRRQYLCIRLFNRSSILPVARAEYPLIQIPALNTKPKGPSLIYSRVLSILKRISYQRKSLLCPQALVESYLRRHPNLLHQRRHLAQAPAMAV